MHDPTKPLPTNVPSVVRSQSEVTRLEAGADGRRAIPSRIERITRNVEGRDAGPKVARAIDRKLHK